MPPIRKHVLLVDDEPMTLLLVDRALRRDVPGTKVTCVDSGGEALQVLARAPVDLLITSLVMPMIDGVELLRHVVNRRLAMPVLVMGGQTTDGTGRLASCAIEVLPEPIEIDRLVRRARELLSAAAGAPEPVLGVRELVRMVALARRTCALRAVYKDRQGVLYFTGGALVDARAGDLHGEAAALAVLAWDDPVTTFDQLLRARPVTITAGIDELLHAAEQSATKPVTAEPVAPEPVAPEPVIEPVAVEPVAAEPVAPSEPPPPPPWESPAAAATISRVLTEAMTIDGALGAAMAVWELDHTLGTRGSLGPHMVETAVAGNCRVMRALLTTLHRLGLRGGVHDVLITLDEQLHILTPLPRHDDLFLYVAIDRGRGNLAMTRHRLQKLLGELAL
jgi:CheY-like chemotaxis protein